MLKILLCQILALLNLHACALHDTGHNLPQLWNPRMRRGDDNSSISTHRFYYCTLRTSYCPRLAPRTSGTRSWSCLIPILLSMYHGSLPPLHCLLRFQANMVLNSFLGRIHLTRQASTLWFAASSTTAGFPARFFYIQKKATPHFRRFGLLLN